MRRMGGWIGARAGGGARRSLTALEEQGALRDALAAAAYIMNDEVERAETELSKGTSPFHKLGLATTAFIRATLGFEKEVMEQASARLAESEEMALEYQKRAIRDPSTAHQSSIYPVGAEFALCHAESQLMSAVVAVLNESLTESLKGFYKLRKAFNTLYEISEAEKTYLKSHGDSARSSQISSAASTTASLVGDTGASEGSGAVTPASTLPEEEDDLDFVDANDDASEAITPMSYQGHLDYLNLSSPELENTVPERVDDGPPSATVPPAVVKGDSKSSADRADEDVDFRKLTTDEIDLFIHSGTSLCFGLLQLLLSMIPPAFARLLSLFSFRGDRENGLRMLWSATKFKHHINGAIAGLITLGFHNVTMVFCDIISADALPDARLRALLLEMLEIYPKSKLWLLEEARMLTADHQLERAVDLLKHGRKSPLRQVEALGKFEVSLSLLYLHRYQECADSFIECVGLNNWSHALYYYFAGVCYVELYRIHQTSDPEKAAEYAKKAEKHLREAPTHLSKRRFMGRQLPFDTFVNRKIMKWEARAKARGCSLVDAVGVSPAVEMTYFWSGFRRMRIEHISKSLERLEWSEDSKLNPRWEAEPDDEKAVLNLLRAVCQRFSGQHERAKATLARNVVCHNFHTLKACEHPDAWPVPVAHYETAVCLWQEAGGEGGEKAVLQKCSDELTRVEKWESFELEARIGLKITTARETLRKCGIKAS